MIFCRYCWYFIIMDVYSPSHPTDQDAECEILPIDFDNIAGNKVVGSENTQCSDKAASDSEFLSNDKEYCPSKSPDLSPSLSSSSNNPGDLLNVEQDNSVLEKTGMHSSSTTKQEENNDRNGNTAPEKESSSVKNHSSAVHTAKKDSVKDVGGEDQRSRSRDRKSVKDRSRREGSSSHKGSSRHSVSKSSRHRGRSPQCRHGSRSPNRSSRRRSSSRSRYRNSRNRQHTRSRSKDSHRRRSRSTSRSKHDRHRRDSHKERKSHSRSRSRSRQNRNRRDTRGSKNERNAFFPSLTELILPPSDSTVPPMEIDSKNVPSECQYDMDETSTPDISEDQNPSFGTMNENAAFVFQSQPPPPPPPLSNAPNFMSWQNQVDNLPTFGQINNRNLQSIPASFIQNAFQQQQQHSPRLSGYNDNFQPHRVVPAPTLRELPPNLMSQRPAFNPVNATRFPGTSQAQLMAFDGMLNPLLPFGLLGQPPPPPPPPPPSLAYTVPPPQFIQQIRSTSNVVFHPPSLNADVTRRTSPPPPPPPPPTQPNLLETLMSKAGLSTDGITGLGNISSGGGGSNTAVSMSAIPLPEPLESKSPMKKISKLLNSAASNLLNQMNTPVRANTCSPPPPPPLPIPGRPGGDVEASVLPTQPHMPPLPPIAGTGAGEISNGNGSVPSGQRRHRHRPENVQELLAKRRRSEFANSREWQERIALEVKSFIKPFYAAGKVSKEDCRTVLKKSVNKVSYNLF